MLPTAEVIIVGAGQGRRMGGPVSKVFMPMAGQPVLLHTVKAFAVMPEITGIILVVPASEEERTRTLCQCLPTPEKIHAIVPGGAHRQESVRIGIDQVRDGADLVLIHDAARPFVTPALILRVIEAAAKNGAAIPGIPVVDTLKQISADQTVDQTIDRRNLVAVQTPQGFRMDILRRAYALAWEKKLSATDDAGLVEQLGVAVTVVPGDPMNFKLTTPLDFKIGEALQSRRAVSA